MIHKISEYISEEKLDKRIREIAAQISADYAKKEAKSGVSRSAVTMQEKVFI